MFPDLVRDEVFRLETPRLWLRWPRPQDVACLAAGAGDREVAEKALDLPHPYPEGAAAEFVLMSRKANAEGTGLSLALAMKGRPGAAIGCVAMTGGSSGEAQLRFWLARRHWERGLMTEALLSLMGVTFNFTALDGVEALVVGLNPAALRVLAKAGFLPAGSEGAALAPRVAERFHLDRERWRRSREVLGGASDADARQRASGASM